MREPVDDIVLIAGAGTMGRQIAAVLAASGANDVRLLDPDAAQRAAAREWIDAFLGDAESSSRIRLLGEYERPDARIALAIEAVPESIELKRRVIPELLRAAPRATVASNSSAVPIARMVDDDAQLERLANLHFYVRPWERRVVELMTSGRTADARMEELRALMQRWEFRVFVLRRPSFGLLYNRIWAAVKREALAVVDEGVAAPEEVDEICRALDPRPARGPFERMDAVGLDTVLLIEQAYAAEYGGSVSSGLDDLVARGRLGRKSGGGFFDYEDVATEGTRT